MKYYPMIEFKKTEDGIFHFLGLDSLKIGVAAKAVNHIDYSSEFDIIRNHEKALIKKITKIDQKDILMLNQIHKDDIILIDNPPKEESLYIASADGMITNICELCLVIRTADCVPVFAFDIKKNILGVAHSGWRGCNLLVSQKLVRKITRVFGSEYKDIYVFILPSIGPNSYSINKDVAGLFKKDIIIKNNKIFLNLWENIENSLIDEGISRENIFNARKCTLLNKNDFFSYRNRELGRNLNFGYIVSRMN